MLKGYKTVIYGVLLALLGILSGEEMRAFLADNLPWVGGIAGGLVVILRAVTTSPLFKKE